MPPCLALSIIRLRSRVKWSNSGKGVAPFSTPRCSSYWKGSLLIALDYGRQPYFLLYIGPVSFFLLHLNSLVSSCMGRLQRKKRKKGGEKKYLLNFNFISQECSVARNVFLDYLSAVISPKQAVEIHQLSPVVNKSKFSVVMSKSFFYVACLGAKRALSNKGKLETVRAPASTEPPLSGLDAS